MESRRSRHARFSFDAFMCEPTRRRIGKLVKYPVTVYVIVYDYLNTCERRIMYVSLLLAGVHY